MITFHGNNELRYFIYSALPFELGQRYVTKFFKSKFVVVVSKPIHVPFKLAKSINDILSNINTVGFIFIVRFYFVCSFFHLSESNPHHMLFKNVAIVKSRAIPPELGIPLVREAYLNGHVKNQQFQ